MYASQGQSSVITAVNSCFVNQQGLFYTVKLKTKLYCIYRCFYTQNYIYPFQNLSLCVILKIFLKFREFQPRYSYKIYSYKIKRVYVMHRTCLTLTKVGIVLKR